MLSNRVPLASPSRDASDLGYHVPRFCLHRPQIPGFILGGQGFKSFSREGGLGGGSGFGRTAAA